MHLEIDRVREPALVDELRRDLIRVLTDVREAVEDWPKMRAQALALADELASAQLPVPDKDITDGSSCCAGSPTTSSPSSATASTRWTPTTDGEPVLAAVLGTGLGILRQDQTGAAAAVAR